MRGKTRIFLVVLLAIALLIGGCGKTAEIVAEVNGHQISKEEFDKKLEEATTALTAGGYYDFSGEEGEQMLSMLQMEVLNQLVMEVLIREEAEKQEITVKSEDVEATINQIKEPYGDELFQELLKQEGMTEAQFKKEIEFMLLQEGLFEKIVADISIEEEQLLEFYQENKEDIVEYRASHILVKFDEEVADKEQDQARAKAKAQSLINELDNGADFAQLAKEQSDDGSAAAGGDLGQYFTQTASPYVPEFTEGTISLGLNEYSKEPVESAYGYHIIKLTDKRETYDELKTSIEAMLEGEVKNRKYNEFFNEVLEKAEIVNHLEEK